jgi:hypothetical protein
MNGLETEEVNVIAIEFQRARLAKRPSWSKAGRPNALDLSCIMHVVLLLGLLEFTGF